MATLTMAGHETSAHTMAWLLWELATHQEFQEKLRAEILEKRAEVNERGDQDFTIEDLESMELLQAALTVYRILRLQFDDKFTETPFIRKHCDTTPLDRKSTRLNSSHSGESRMPSSA